MHQRKLIKTHFVPNFAILPQHIPFIAGMWQCHYLHGLDKDTTSRLSLHTDLSHSSQYIHNVDSAWHAVIKSFFSGEGNVWAIPL